MDVDKTVAPLRNFQDLGSWEAGKGQRPRKKGMDSSYSNRHVL